MHMHVYKYKYAHEEVCSKKKEITITKSHPPETAFKI